jgi:hypothetical protein
MNTTIVIIILGAVVIMPLAMLSIKNQWWILAVLADYVAVGLYAASHGVE